MFYTFFCDLVYRCTYSLQHSGTGYLLCQAKNFEPTEASYVIMILPVLLLIVSVGTRFAAASNKSVITTIGWVSEPYGRGTFSLVLSCVLTLGLCVWSAMHLNIPPHNVSRWHTWIRSFSWGLTGIFAPELLVFAAWRQHNSAKQLHLMVNSHIARSSTKVR